MEKIYGKLAPKGQQTDENDEPTCDQKTVSGSCRIKFSK